MSTAEISVVIPTYNRAAFLGDAVQSVMDQSNARVEIIIADDGSTDNTAEVLDRFGGSVRYVRLPHRGQPAATRNAGLREAHGEFVAFLDSDDLFMPEKFRLQLAAFEAHPEAGLIYSNGHFFRDAASQPTGYVLDGLPMPSGNVFAELLRGNFLSTPTVLIRRACLERVGFYDERPDFFAVEDYDLWLRIAAEFSIIYVPGDVAAVRRHGKSISGDTAALRGRMLRVLEKTDQLYPKLMRAHRDERHEAYARSHGAVAIAQLQQWNLGAGFIHGVHALSHTLRLRDRGRRAITEWWVRRRLRARLLI
ncbi:MAG: glycosyltransferase [Acidobacteriota bacterium]